MLLPQVWDRCYRSIESTTNWCETRDRELTKVYCAGYQSGNPGSSQHPIGGYLAALEGKQRELNRLQETVVQAYDELARTQVSTPADYLAHRIQDEKESVMAVLNLVEHELADQTQDWRSELQTLGAPQAEPAKLLSSSLLDPLRTLMARFSRPQSRGSLSYGLQLPKLRLRRGRRRGSSNRKQV